MPLLLIVGINMFAPAMKGNTFFRTVHLVVLPSTNLRMGVPTTVNYFYSAESRKQKAESKKQKAT
jgi:hypothetical protein